MLYPLSISLAMSACVTKEKPQQDSESKQNLYLLVGTYNSLSKSDTGIYVYRFDTLDASSKLRSAVTGVEDPSYLAVAPNEKNVYAVSEGAGDNARVNAFWFDKKEGTLTFLNSEPAAGDHPCFITVDPAGRMVVLANYTGGNVTVFGVGKEGRLSPLVQNFIFSGSGPDSLRQEKSHLHSTRFTPDGRFMFATDLGSDKVYKFAVSPEDSVLLAPGDPSYFAMQPGNGPRHMDWHPNQKFYYVLNELSGTIDVFDYLDGNIVHKQSIEADSLHVKASADLHISPDGNYLYATNRKEGDGIAIFKINPEGFLTRVGYTKTGRHPRNFILTPDGKFLLLASRDDNRIEIYKVNAQNGQLTDTGKRINVGAPVCLQFISQSF